MNNQDQNQTFCIDDLIDELYIYVKKELQNAGKSNVNVEIYKKSREHTCRIQANRELLRQALVHLLDNAVKYTDRGFIMFGYHVLDTNLVDFFVNDTGAGEYNDTVIDLSAVRDLLQQMGSRLKEEITGTGSSYSFSIKSTVELTKIT